MDFSIIPYVFLCFNHKSGKKRCIANFKALQLVIAAPMISICLFLAEGLAVSALIHGGICLVGTNQNTVQAAVIFIAAMMRTLLNGAFNALICVTIHRVILLYLGDRNSISCSVCIMQTAGYFLVVTIDNCDASQYNSCGKCKFSKEVIPKAVTVF